ASAPVGAAPPAALDDPPIDLPAATAARGEGPPELPASAGRPAALGSSGDFLASAAFLDPEAESPGHLPPSSGSAAPTTPPPPARPVDDVGGESSNAPRISVRGSVPRERPASDDPDTAPGTKRVNPLADILSPAREQARKDADRRGSVTV